MRVVVVGATGHIGSYLVPRLVSAGHHVITISRGERSPYFPHPAWDKVEWHRADRRAEEHQGTFGQRISALSADAVIDLICFSLDSATQLAEALMGSSTYLLHCGTIWVHGPAVSVPITEDAPRRPLEPYGIAKAEVERYLHDVTRSARLKATILHPGHIVGPGWHPVNPAGNLSLDVFSRLAQGMEVVLPNFGLETLHHVHAYDVASAFLAALERPGLALGESFHVVSEAALTMRGYAEAVASWFGQPARLSYLPFSAWRDTVTADEARMSYDHVAHSPSVSIGKARRLLSYAPRYSSLEAVHEALAALIAAGALVTGGRRLAPFATSYSPFA